MDPPVPKRFALGADEAILFSVISELLKGINPSLMLRPSIDDRNVREHSVIG
jgi:hypothetical protein